MLRHYISTATHTLRTNKILVLVICSNILAIGAIYYLSTLNPYVVARSKYPLIDPARNFLEQEHFITNIQPLRDSLNNLASINKNSEIGIYFEFLNTGANISINQNLRFVPGSLTKMPTAMATMKKVEQGKWKLSNKLIILEEDRNPSFGDLYKTPIGTLITIEELLENLLVFSDDTAHRVLIRNLEVSELLDVFSGLGLEDLYDKEYDITSKEYSRIFRALYTSSYLTREGSQYLLNLLAETSFDTFLESGVEPTTKFAHKIGIYEPDKTYLDSGIVYLENRPYILTVAIKTTVDRKFAEELMYDISKQAYEYIKNY